MIMKPGILAGNFRKVSCFASGVAKLVVCDLRAPVGPLCHYLRRAYLKKVDLRDGGGGVQMAKV